MKVQVVLRETELEAAISKYIIEAGYPVDGMQMKINLIKGRTAGSTRAEVDLVPAGEDSPVVETKETVVDKIEDILEDVVDSVEDTIEDIKEAVEDVKDEGLSFLTEKTEKTVEKVVAKADSLFS